MPTVVSYPLGLPPAVTAMGGDCRAFDVTQGHQVVGPHVFAASTDIRISNGMLRVTVGATGTTPTLTLAGWLPGALLTAATVYDDTTTYTDATTYADAVYAAPTWTAAGSIVIDSPAVTAVLTRARVVSVSPEAVTIHLYAAAIGDAYVTLRRGFRTVDIQHGANRPPLITAARRVRFTGSPSATGTAASGRVYEAAPAIGTSPRMVAAATTGATADAATFAVTSPSVSTASVAAGLAGQVAGDTVADLHAQAFDGSRPGIKLGLFQFGTVITTQAGIPITTQTGVALTTEPTFV